MRVREIGALSGLIVVMLVFTLLSDKFLTWLYARLQWLFAPPVVVLTW